MWSFPCQKIISLGCAFLKKINLNVTPGAGGIVQCVRTHAAFTEDWNSDTTPLQEAHNSVTPAPRNMTCALLDSMGSGTLVHIPRAHTHTQTHSFIQN